METLNLHARQKRLLSVLNKKRGAASGKELAASLNVSERTVRSDIKEINEQLAQYGISINPLYGKGYSLSIQDRRVFVELFSERESYVSRDDRVRTLLIRLLRESDWCELGNLEDEMFVSRTTLENDLKTVKKRISARHPYLQMERKGNYVRLENNEVKRRDILVHIYAEYWDYDSREGIVLKHGDLGAEMLRDVQSVLKEALGKWKIRLDDSAFIYMTLSVAMMYSRVRDGHMIRHTEVSRPDSDLSDVVLFVVEKLNEGWKMEFRRAELIWLSDILKQLELLCSQTYSKNYVLEHTDVLCHHIVNNLLERIEKRYGIDFTSDERLFVDLTKHVQALFDGIVAPQIQNHIIGDELRRRYPFLGDVACFARKYLEEQCEIELGKEEENYLFPFLISAQQLLWKKKRDKGVLTCVISHLNASVTHYLMEQLRSRYRDRLDLRGPYPIHAKEMAFAAKPALILSTARTASFNTVANAPVITISPMVEPEERKKIEQYIEREMCASLFGELPKPLQEYFPADLVYRMDNKESLTTTLTAMKNRIQEKLEIDALQNVDPERDYSVLLKNGLLFLYQTSEEVEAPVLSLVGLKRSISWKHLRSVQTILYMVIPEEEMPKIGWFYHYACYLAGKADLQMLLDKS